MLDVKKLSLAVTMEERIFRLGNNQQGKIMEKYIAAYESWHKEQGREMEEGEFKTLESNMDGSYWSK